MTESTSTRQSMTGEPLPLARLAPRVGPPALVASASVALLTTLAAATVWPGLAQHGHRPYLLSGVTMTAADLLYVVGLVALVRSDAIRPGRLRTVCGVLAVAASLGVVVAEVLLRVDFGVGTSAFAVVGPVQAVGVVGLGIGVLVSRRWTGWRRWPLLAQGLYVPLVLVPALAASGGQNLAALAGLHALILVFGVAFAVESAAPARGAAPRA